MSKRARYPTGFYGSLQNDVSDRSESMKYRPEVKPTDMGVYEVEPFNNH